MKRIFSLLLVIFLNTATYSFTDTIINDIESFSKLFPRNEASVEEKESMEMISSRLTELGLEFSRSEFDETEGYHSYSSYIQTIIPGKINDTLITVVPVDGSYGIAAALSVIEHYAKTGPELSMMFVFLGAEQYDENNPGTRILLEQYYPENSAAFLYLNFSGVPESFRIVPGSDGFSSPYYLFRAVTSSLKGAGIPWSHSNTESILFRLGSAGTESRIGDYLSEGYPAIQLSAAATADDDYSNIIGGDDWISFYDNLLKEFKSGLPVDWDSHYIFGISEEVYLLIYIVLLTLLMVYPIFRRKHFGWYMRTLGKNFWSLVLLFASVFVFLALASLLISVILNYIGFPEKWKYIPVVVFLFKITVSMLFYSIAFRFISRLPFSRRGSFYSISAIFFLVIALLVLSAINLSLSFFALWPLCFIFLFTVFRKPLVKFLMLLLSALWIFFSLFEIFTLPSLTVIELITLSPVQGDLLVAVILLPYILAGIRLDLLSPVSGRVTRFIPPILGIVSAGLLAAIIFYSPFGESSPQPVYITDIYYQDSGRRILSLDSPRDVDSSLEASFYEAVPLEENIINDIRVEVSSRPFLNRKIINSVLDFKMPPERIRFWIDTTEPLILYESSLPAEWLPSRNRLEVYIGRNPELPLDLSLTLNRDAEPAFNIEAGYAAESRLFKADGKSYMLIRSLTVRKEYSGNE